jgi:phosphate acetyltransferase
VIHLLGCIPENAALRRYRVQDVIEPIQAQVLREGDLAHRRVNSVHLLARTVPNLLNTFQPGALLLTPADRVDILMAVALASSRGIQLAGLVLTGEGDRMQPDRGVLELCSSVADPGLPVLMAHTSSYEIVSRLEKISPQIPADDAERLNTTLDFIARHVDCRWLVEEHLAQVVEKRLSPPAFRFRLAERARAANQRILLPEGTEPRILRAAVECHRRGIARCVLLGRPEEIRHQTEAIGEALPEAIEIIDPDAVRERYVPALVEMRKHKRLTEELALGYLESNTYLATVMLALDEADGLVAGASHSTADTIRPALQLIRTAPYAKVVSSVFFMCLPDQVLVYGDCAVNPDPNAEMLADIAVRSAESAETFGIPPRVALISYSTGASGKGADVDKVRAATERAKKLRPDLPIDGPLQYDAAAIPAVAKKKAPDSPVAGRATVFIFPDLNTGNTTYKAVQRSANVISIGPMLQGLNKPVNDLSRGALVDDIIYTIALTAIQADQRRKQEEQKA